MGGAAMTLGTALAGSVLLGAGDGRGAVEPQAAPSSAATSATAASFQCEVDAGPRASHQWTARDAAQPGRGVAGGAR